MAMTIPAATARLQRELIEAEATVDTSISSIAALLNSATTARAEINDVAPAETQAALLRLHKSLGTALTLRSDMMRTHGALLDVARETGIGVHPDCPDGNLKAFASDDAIKAG